MVGTGTLTVRSCKGGSIPRGPGVGNVTAPCTDPARMLMLVGMRGLALLMMRMLVGMGPASRSPLLGTSHRSPGMLLRCRYRFRSRIDLRRGRNHLVMGNLLRGLSHPLPCLLPLRMTSSLLGNGGILSRHLGIQGRCGVALHRCGQDVFWLGNRCLGLGHRHVI